MKKDLKKVESLTVSEVENSSTRRTQEVNVQTVHYGDKLKSTGFVPVNSDSSKPTSVQAESKGVKVNAKLTPVFDATGKKIGDRLDLEAEAKPVAHSNFNSKNSADSTAGNSKFLNQKASREGSLNTSFDWCLPLVIILLLLGLILFRSWLFKILFNGK